MFWPPALILIFAVGASLINFDGFLSLTTAINGLILKNLDWLFSIASFSSVIIMLILVISPLGAVRIGGADAKPILSRWNWFAITLCTTIAIGILFWGAAEPMFHISAPPNFSDAEPYSPKAARFALSSLYLHWTITPYALYSIPALAFALAYYNHGKDYSLSGPISLLTKPFGHKNFANFLDAIALFALVAGVAAALGAGVLSVVGGARSIFGLADSVALRFVITFIIVTCFIISSLSGLQRGIKWLSSLNARIFIALALFVFVAGPTREIITLSGQSLWHYIVNFVPANLAIGERTGDPWTRDWTIFFFANWLAWAPVTALFLGRIAVGYSVREFVLFNLALPALFSILWMSIFGGAAIHLDTINNNALANALTSQGPEAVIYTLLELLPFFKIVGVLFLLTVFISFVTAMDSNTLSIAGLCLNSKKINTSSEQTQKEENKIKIFWGLLIGSLSFIMTSTTGIDGVRMLSNLGGVPGLFILILCALILLKLMTLHIIEARQKRANIR